MGSYQVQDLFSTGKFSIIYSWNHLFVVWHIFYRHSIKRLPRLQSKLSCLQGPLSHITMKIQASNMFLPVTTLHNVKNTNWSYVLHCKTDEMLFIQSTFAWAFQDRAWQLKHYFQYTQHWQQFEAAFLE